MKQEEERFLVLGLMLSLSHQKPPKTMTKLTTTLLSPTSLFKASSAGNLQSDLDSLKTKVRNAQAWDSRGSTHSLTLFVSCSRSFPMLSKLLHLPFLRR